MSEHKYLTDEEIGKNGAEVMPYRTGRTLGTTIYRDGEDQPCAWAPGNPKLAAEIVAALNTYDRIRKALEDARKWLYASELIAVKPLISDLDRALNPQPAPPEVPKPQTFREGHPVYVCRQCSKQYKEHGQNEECPVGAQGEAKQK